MNNKNFWTSAASNGAVVGLFLAVTYAIETTLTVKASGAALLQILSLLFFAGHYFLLHYFTRRRSMLYTVEEGYSFGQAWAYVQMMSLLSGVILGAGFFIYLHTILGYDVFIEFYKQTFAEAARVSGDVATGNMMIKMLDEMPEPSPLVIIFSFSFMQWLFGALYGLVIAGFARRRPQLFNTHKDNE